MGDKIFFVSEDKSFEVVIISDDFPRWFSIIERNRCFSSNTKIDEDNLRWVCDNLKQASRGAGDLYRRWGRKQQAHLLRVYQNYNVYGRFVRIEA